MVWGGTQFSYYYNGTVLHDLKLGERIMKRVLLSILITVVLLWNCSTVFTKDRDKGSQSKQANKENWKTFLPPGWKNWDNAKKQKWEHGLNRAKNAVRKHTETRLNAALRTLEMVARKGVPLHHAEQTAKAGLEHGLGPFDFEPFGKFVVERVKAGVKGEELARAIHEETNRRRQERERLREEMKEKVKQRQEDHKRLREEMKEKVKQRQEDSKRLREKMKEKKELGRPRKERSLGKGDEEQEKGRGKHGRPHPEAERDKGKGEQSGIKKGGGPKGRR